MKKVTITIAWVSLSGMRKTGRMIRPDGVNYAPEFEAAPEPHAVVWLNEGTAADVKKAKAYAASGDITSSTESAHKVYLFPTSEPDPLGKAKAKALAEYSKKRRRNPRVTRTQTFTPADALPLLKLEIVHYRQSGRGAQFLRKAIARAKAAKLQPTATALAVKEAQALLQKKNPLVLSAPKRKLIAQIFIARGYSNLPEFTKRQKYEELSRKSTAELQSVLRARNPGDQLWIVSGYTKSGRYHALEIAATSKARALAQARAQNRNVTDKSERVTAWTARLKNGLLSNFRMIKAHDNAKVAEAERKARLKVIEEETQALLSDPFYRKEPGLRRAQLHYLNTRRKALAKPARRTNAARQLVEEYKGYKIYFEGSSYSCPQLKIYGERNDLACRRAIDRKLKKKNPGAASAREGREVIAEAKEYYYKTWPGTETENRAYGQLINAYEYAGFDRTRAHAAASREANKKSKAKIKNPSVRELAETFQGRANGAISEYKAASSAPGDLARIGKLIFLKLKDAPRQIRAAGAMVAVDTRGRLWVVGKQSLFTPKAKAPGEALDYGEIDKICYETAKAHIENGKVTEYVHTFGEDGGKRPRLLIDHEGMPILRGGDYKIKAEGIVD